MNQKALNYKYILIQSFYCLLICAVSGYASIFLLNKGFTNSVIGTIIAISNILAVCGQQFFANVIDKSTKYSIRGLLMILIIILIVLSTFLLLLTKASLSMIIIFIIVLTIVPLLAPFINSLIFIFEKHNIHINFGLARGMGSGAYALASLFFGNLVASYNPQLLPYFYIILSFILFIVIYSFRTPLEKENLNEQVIDEIPALSYLQFIKKYKLFIILLVAIILLFFNFNIINIFLIQIIQHVGGNSSNLGFAMFLAAAVELPTMGLFYKIQKKYNDYYLIMFAAFFFSVKNLLTLIATNIGMIYIAQFLQMFSYAIFLPASVYIINRILEPKDLIRGQAFMTGAMSLSSVFASYIGGILLDTIGVINTLLYSFIISLIGTLLVFYCITKLKNKTNLRLKSNQ